MHSKARFWQFHGESQASQTLACAMHHRSASDGKENQKRGESTVSIQKKSLINTLKSAKKANVVKEDVTVSGATVSAAKAAPMKALRVAGKAAPMKALRTAGKSAPMKALRTARAPRAIKPE